MNRVLISIVAALAAFPASAAPTKVASAVAAAPTKLVATAVVTPAKAIPPTVAVLPKPMVPTSAVADPATGPGRFSSEIAAFGQRHAVPAKGDVTLFVGSSSIRLWNVAQSFPTLHPVNRGFGGATVGDVLFHYDRVVAGVRPRSVIVYVGENDVAIGEPADRVSAAVLKLLARLRKDNPDARIAYLSMKPTPQRWELYPRMAEINALVRARAGKEFDYLDVGGALMTAGRPDADYFTVDGLHMNARGYSVWNGIVERWMKPAAPEQKVADRGAATS